MKRKVFSVVFLILLKLCPLLAQSGKQWIDSTEMLIGDQQILHVNTQQKDSGDLALQILDTLSWMYVIDKGEWTNKDNSFERSVLFTVFDSGYFQIPALFDGANTLYINVNNPTDSLGQLRQIKDIETTAVSSNLLTWIIIGLVVLALMLGLLYLLFRADRAGKINFVPEKQLMPWELAIQSLHRLEKEHQENLDRRLFYDKLNIIVRLFLSDGCKVPSLENNSSVIMDFIAKERMKLNQQELLRENFRITDLVKFAHLETDQQSDMRWLEMAKSFVEKNTDYAKQLNEVFRQDWNSLLGEKLASQMEYPDEKIPELIQQLCANYKKTQTLHLMSGILSKHQFELPAELVELHHSRQGRFSRWHMSLAGISQSHALNIIIMLFVLPVAALALPIVVIISRFTKENIFGKGMLVLSQNNRLLLNYNAL